MIFSIPNFDPPQTKKRHQIDALHQQLRLYHYLSTAKSNYREYLKGETVRLKKYFYVLRPLLACKWILSEGTPPPVLFSELMDKYLDESIREDVLKLLDLKMNKPEIAEGKRFEKVNGYIDRNIDTIEELIKSLPATHDNDWDELNKVFLSVLAMNRQRKSAICIEGYA